jgi:hypothetical protein
LPSPHLPSASLARFIEVVDSLPLAVDDPSREGLVSALNALASVIDELPRQGRAASEIRSLAAQLASPGSIRSIEIVDSALRAAIRAMAADDRETSSADVKVSFALASGAVERLQGEPLVEQNASVLAAFRAITTALLAIEGTTHPDYTVRYPLAIRSLDAMREHVDAANIAVSDLASAPTWAEGRVSAARALDEIAMVLATVPVSDSRARVLLAAAAASIRYDAARLRNVGGISFQKVEWVRHSLRVAHDALNGLHGQGDLASRLLVQSRRATEALTGHTSFVFERAAIQDAMRATMSSLVAVTYAIVAT